MAYTASVLIRDSSRNPAAWLENCLYPGYSFRVNEVYTAHFSLPADDSKASYLTLRALFELYENDGTSLGLFRIVEIEHVRMGRGVLITCRGEHVISTLLDDFLIGEHEIVQEGATPTTDTAIEYILAEQTTVNWAFGTEAFSRNFWYKWKDQSLLEALLDVPARFGEDYVWTYSTAAYPWTVSLAAPSAVVSGYITYGKNIEEIRKRQVSGELFNRIYPYGIGDYPNQLTIASVNGGVEYLEDAGSVSTYGRIVRVWNDQRYTDATNLKTAAQKLLTDHATPPVYYEVDAADLSQLGTVAADRITIGSLITVYDSDMGVDVDVLVVAISKPDMLGQPGAVELELSNKIPEFDLDPDYGTPDTEDTIGSVGNLVPNYSFERLSGPTPRFWTLDSWEQTTAEAFEGARSLKGLGTAKTAYSDKVSLPQSLSALRVRGHAMSSATTPSPAEVANVATTSAPIAYCHASGTLVAVPRQSSSYDIIDLYDVSDMAAPFKVGTVSEASEHRSKPFRIYGDYLFCCATGHLYVYDISDPTTPTEVEDYALDSGTAIARSMVVRDWTVYLGCDDGASDFIEIVDALNPMGLVQVYAGTPASSPAATITWGHRDMGLTGDDLIVMKSDGAYVTPAGTASGTGWTNPTNVNDGNTATSASMTSLAAGAWTEYLIAPIGSTAQVDGLKLYLWLHSTNHTDWDVEMDVYDTDAASWANVYSETVAYNDSNFYLYATISPAKNANSVRVRMRNNDSVSADFILALEVWHHALDAATSVVYLVAYDVATKALPVYKCNDSSTDLKNLVVNGSYYYACEASGTNANKIAVFTRATATSITGPTYVGAAGTPNYTGSDALFMTNGYLVNVGAGTSGSYYSVSYWSVATPATPSRVAVAADITGDMDAASGAGGLVAGVDVDNTKLRLVTAEGADWTMTVRFYDAADTLVSSIEVYDGNSDLPVTTGSWCRFEYLIPIEDIPQSATQVDVILTTNTGADSVYVDALSILAESAS